ncbi:MAG: ATP-dependent DNA helicase [Saprospiraceae bacterium]
MDQIPISSTQFRNAYEKLNVQQKEAVDRIEGPVMVVAGPGTGKTQILATRIANILYQSVADAENILCLTYTEAGAFAMRKRLNELVGTTGNNVSIHTFHSFCNRVIQENSNIFKYKYEYRIAEILDQCELLEKILAHLPSDDIHYKPDQEYKPILKRILNLFDSIKKENWNTKELSDSIHRHMESLSSDPRFIYKNSGTKYKKGDLKKKDYNEELDRFKKTLSAISLYDQYNDLLKANNLFDYNDLINSVIVQFKNNDDLLAYYQEKFQYILVDEFQDTNGSQIEILSLLISYWEKPNVFVVGDGDQAIYRFQGANVKNLIDFKNKYDPIIISLDENYRSSQAILNLAEEFISSNNERLKEKAINGINALISKRDHVDSKPILKIYNSVIEEVSDVTFQIEQLIQIDKIEAKNIAVLFRKNSDSDEFAKELSLRNIPFTLSKELNVLNHPLIKYIISILQYIHQEYKMPFSSDNILYDILHAPFVDIGTKDIGLLAFSMRTNFKIENTGPEEKFKQSLRNALSNEEILKNSGVQNVSEFLEFGKITESLISDVNNYTLQVFIEKILYDFQIIPFILNIDKNIELLEIVNSFYEYVKSVSVKYPDITIDTLMELFERLKTYEISIPYINIVGDENAVKLSTIHSSKGLEYTCVFVVKNIKTSNRNGNSFKLPPEFSYIDNSSDTEEERRLYYVALTRAEKKLQISYSKNDAQAKVKEGNLLINEVEQSKNIQLNEREITTDYLKSSIINQLSFVNKKYELIDDERINRFLETFVLSVTSLEKYLKCPVAFYYEKILRVPGSRSVYMGFGNAVHKTLEDYVHKFSNFNSINSDVLNALFEKSMNIYRSHFTSAEFSAYTELGKKSIPEFLKTNSSEWLQVKKIIPELNFGTRYHLGVPISGKLDRLDELDSTIKIIDYKTGKPNSAAVKSRLRKPTVKDAIGGEYWRQMIFYSILCDTDIKYAGKIHSGTFYFVVPDNNGTFHHEKVEVCLEDKIVVGNQIKETYAKILNKEFTMGCNKPDCRWCNFLSHDVISSDIETEEDSEEF